MYLSTDFHRSWVICTSKQRAETRVNKADVVNRLTTKSPTVRCNLGGGAVTRARNLVLKAASEGVAPVSAEEEEANKKRWEESGNKQGSIDKWRWTLNWDDITEKIVVGSCPRSPEDLDRLVEEAKIDAVLCLQSDICHEALQIDWMRIRARALERGILMSRVAVRDFDKNDQAIMLPEAVRCLHLLLGLGLRVYVHCTAGINRATLTVVGYLTFVKGMALEDAVDLVQTARPQAHPYIDCWKMVRARLVSDRGEEIGGLARVIYATRMEESVTRNKNDDWYAAEDMLVQETFKRQREATMSMFGSLQVMHDSKLKTVESEFFAAVARAEQAEAAVAAAAARAEQAEAAVAAAAARADQAEAAVAAAVARAEQAEAVAAAAAVAQAAKGVAVNGHPIKEEVLVEDDLQLMPEECTLQLGEARKELAVLKDAIAEVAHTTHNLLGEEENAPPQPAAAVELAPLAEVAPQDSGAEAAVEAVVKAAVEAAVEAAQQIINGTEDISAVAADMPVLIVENGANGVVIRTNGANGNENSNGNGKADASMSNGQ